MYEYICYCFKISQELYLRCMNCCFRYIYSGRVTLSTDSVLGLLVLADKYNVPDLKECCSYYMGRHLVRLECNKYTSALLHAHDQTLTSCSTNKAYNLSIVITRYDVIPHYLYRVL